MIIPAAVWALVSTQPLTEMFRTVALGSTQPLTEMFRTVALVSTQPLTEMSRKVNTSHHRPEVSRGFQEVKVPRLRDNDPGWW